VPKRVSWTKQAIYFTQTEETIETDFIPLEEIGQISCSFDLFSKSKLDQLCLNSKMNSLSSAPSLSNGRKQPSTAKTTNTASNNEPSIQKKLSNLTSDCATVDSTKSRATAEVDVNHGSKPKADQVGRFQDECRMFQIRTINEGFNSGRTYCLRAPTEKICGLIVADLTVRSKAAKKSAEAKSRFEKCQERVRRVFDSKAFQLTIASLIFLVRYLGF
jgi:hypothetical protein